MTAILQQAGQLNLKKKKKEKFKSDAACVFWVLQVRRSQHDVGDAELRSPGGGRGGRRSVARRVPQVPGETRHHAVVIGLYCR